MQLEIRHVSKTCRNSVQALKTVSLTIQPGMYGLLGPGMYGLLGLTAPGSPPSCAHRAIAEILLITDALVER